MSSPLSAVSKSNLYQFRAPWKDWKVAGEGQSDQEDKSKARKICKSTRSG